MRIILDLDPLKLHSKNTKTTCSISYTVIPLVSFHLKAISELRVSNYTNLSSWNRQPTNLLLLPTIWIIVDALLSSWHDNLCQKHHKAYFSFAEISFSKWIMCVYIY